MTTFKQFLNEENYVNFENYTDINLLQEAILEEYHAMKVYSLMAKQAKDSNVRKVLEHVAQEEKVHVEEFREILEKLDSEVESAEDQAEDELKDMKLKFSKTGED